MRWADIWHRRSDVDETTRDWLILSSGTAVRLLLGFVSGIIVARVLGPEQFGRYALLGAVSSITGVFIDMGLTETAVKRIAAGQVTDPERAKLEANYYFWLRFILASLGIVLGTGFIVAAERVLDPIQSPTLLVLALLSAGTATLSGSINAMLQGLGRFSQLVIVLVTSSLLVLIGSFSLAQLGNLNVLTAMMVSLVVPLPVFYLGYRLLPSDWRGIEGVLDFAGWQLLAANARSYFAYGRWLWISNLFKVSLGYLDLFLVNRWLDASQLGIYALALNLASKAEFINHSLYAVLIPTAAALTDRAAVQRYLRLSLRRSFYIGLGLLVVAPLASWLIPRVYGAAYVEAVPLFLALLAIAFFDILTLPAIMLIYTYDKPQFTAASGALQVAILFVLGSLLIPLFGAWGMVTARMVSRATGAGYVLVRLRQHYRNLHRAAPSA